MKERFQLFSKCFGVVLMCGGLIYLVLALLQWFSLQAPPAFAEQWEMNGQMSRVRNAIVMNLFTMAVVPAAIGFYLTRDRNVFVSLCYPD